MVASANRDRLVDRLNHTLGDQPASNHPQLFDAFVEALLGNGISPEMIMPYRLFYPGQSTDWLGVMFGRNQNFGIGDLSRSSRHDPRVCIETIDFTGEHRLQFRAQGSDIRCETRVRPEVSDVLTRELRHLRAAPTRIRDQVMDWARSHAPAGCDTIITDADQAAVQAFIQVAVVHGLEFKLGPQPDGSFGRYGKHGRLLLRRTPGLWLEVRNYPVVSPGVWS